VAETYPLREEFDEALGDAQAFYDFVLRLLPHETHPVPWRAKSPIRLFGWSHAAQIAQRREDWQFGHALDVGGRFDPRIDNFNEQDETDTRQQTDQCTGGRQESNGEQTITRADMSGRGRAVNAVIAEGILLE